MQKRSRMKKFLLLCTVVMLAVSMLVVPAQADNSGETRALDIMFVIDSSGSMLSTDPNRIAMAASNLFADMCDYDEAGSIGKRYRREDEIGTPFCITVDFETETDGCVTVRERDTMEQVRIPVSEVAAYVKERIKF